MASKRPVGAVLDALDNAQAQDFPPPAKKTRGRPRGSVTKKKSDFHNLPLAPIIADDDVEAPEVDIAEPPPPQAPIAVKIFYTLDIYSISQMKKTTKSRGPSIDAWADPSDLPGNKAVALKIGELRQTWACNTPSCEHTHCWVHPERGSHIPLSHTLLNRWASAILKNNGSASMHKPPNHLSFDNVPENLKGEPSTLVERCKAAQKQATTSSAPMPVQIFNGFTPEVLQALNLPMQVAPAMPVMPTLGSSSSNVTSYGPNSPLLPKSGQPQSSLPLSDFCAMYALSTDILSRFVNNGYGTLTQLSYTTLQDLRRHGIQAW